MKATPRRWVNRLFKGFSLVTVAFVFQACYGSPRDFGMDQYIEGSVTNTDGNPLANINISLSDSIQCSQTDAEGKFYFYVPKKEKYTILFSEINGDSIYQSKDTTIYNGNMDIPALFIVLDKK